MLRSTQFVDGLLIVLERSKRNNASVVVYYCRTYVKAVRGGGSEEGGRVLWDATSRGLCGRVGPPRTNVRAAWANCERGGSR
jgi:hypothetical protein